MAIQEIGVRVSMDTSEFNSGVEDFVAGIRRMNESARGLRNIQLPRVPSGRNSFGGMLESMNSNLSSINFMTTLGTAMPILGGIVSGFSSAISMALNFGSTVASITFSGLRSTLETVISLVDIAFTKLSDYLQESVKKSMGYEQSLADMMALTDIKPEAAKQLTDYIEELTLDPKLQATSADIIRVAQDLGTMGYKMNDLINGMIKNTILLANATGADLPLATEVLGMSMKSFNKNTSESGQVVDQIVTTLQEGKTSMDDYKYVLAGASTTANAAGLSFDRFNQMTILTSKNFAGGQTQGSAFNAMLERLINQTDETKKSLEGLGISVTDSLGKLKDPLILLQEIGSAMKKGVFKETVTVTPTVDMSQFLPQQIIQNELDDLAREKIVTDLQIEVPPPPPPPPDFFNEYIQGMKSRIAGYQQELNRISTGKGVPDWYTNAATIGDRDYAVDTKLTRPLIEQQELLQQALTEGIGGTDFQLWMEEKGKSFNDSYEKTTGMTVETIEQNINRLKEIQARMPSIPNLKPYEKSISSLLTEYEKLGLWAKIFMTEGSRMAMPFATMPQDEITNAEKALQQSQGTAEQAAKVRTGTTQATVNRFFELLDSIQLKIGNILTPTLQAVVSDINPIVESFFRFIKPVSEYLATILPQYIDPLRESIKNFFTEILNTGNIGDYFQLSPETLQTLQTFQTLFNQITKDGQSFITSTDWSQIFTQLSPSFETIYNDFYSLFTKIGTDGLAIISDLFIKIMESPIFSKIYDLLTPVLDKAKEKLLEFGKSVLDKIIEKGKDFVYNFTENFWSLLKEVLFNNQENQQSLINLGKKIGEWIWIGLKELWTMENVGKLLAEFTKLVAASAAAIINIGANIAAGILSGLIESITGWKIEPWTVAKLNKSLASAFTSITETIIQIFTDMFTSIIDMVPDSMTRFGKAMADNMPDISSYMPTIPDTGLMDALWGTDGTPTDTKNDKGGTSKPKVKNINLPTIPGATANGVNVLKQFQELIPLVQPLLEDLNTFLVETLSISFSNWIEQYRVLTEEKIPGLKDAIESQLLASLTNLNINITTIVIPAMTAFATYISTELQSACGLAGNLVQKLSEYFDKLKISIENALKATEKFVEYWPKLQNILQKEQDYIRELKEKYDALAESIRAANEARKEQQDIGDSPVSGDSSAGGDSGSPGFAKGGQFIVPQGYNNFGMPIRVHSGELVTVLTRAQTESWKRSQIRSKHMITNNNSSVINNNDKNQNFNLTVNSIQSTNTLVKSFNLMKALAG